MDDRGTPINKGPIIGSKDVDLYKLFKVCIDWNALEVVVTVNSVLLITSRNTSTKIRNIIKVLVNCTEK
jgi:hypothetical protein